MVEKRDTIKNREKISKEKRDERTRGEEQKGEKPTNRNCNVKKLLPMFS